MKRETQVSNIHQIPALKVSDSIWSLATREGKGTLELGDVDGAESPISE